MRRTCFTHTDYDRAELRRKGSMRREFLDLVSCKIAIDDDLGYAFPA